MYTITFYSIKDYQVSQVWLINVFLHFSVLASMTDQDEPNNYILI